MFNFFLCLVSVCIINTRRYSFLLMRIRETLIAIACVTGAERDTKKLCSPTNVAKEICFLFKNPDGRNFLNLHKWKKAKNVSSSPLTNSFCKLLGFLPAIRVVCSCFRVKATLA